MDYKIQLIGLNEFLTAVYQSETRISTLLFELGFEKEKIELLRDYHLEPVVVNFIAVIKEQLGDDRLFYIISRRFGLDGESKDTLQIIGDKLNISRERVRQLEYQAIKRCKYKKSLKTFSVRLHDIALEQLGLVAERPTPEYVVGKLDKLTEITTALDTLQIDYEAKRAEILKTVQNDLEVLEAEYTPIVQEMRDGIAKLKAEIKNDVLLNGSTIRSSRYKAVYMRGRVTWDTKGITKYAEVNPEIMKFRRQGRPSVSIRSVRSVSNKSNQPSKKAEQHEVKHKAYSVEEIQQEFPRAYERWTSEEDERLKQQYVAGINIPALAKYFGRNKGAIQSRLKKLNILE